MSGQAAQDIIDRLRAIQVDAAAIEDKSEHARVVSEVTRLLLNIEQPFETLIKLVWANPALLAALKVFKDVDIIANWGAAGGGEKTAAEIFKLANCDIELELIARCLRHMAAAGVLDVTGADRYKPTKFFSAMAEPNGAASAINYGFDCNLPGFVNLPAFLASTSYRNPASLAINNWSHMTGGKESTCFDMFATNPQAGQAFQDVMRVYAEYKLGWTEIYDADLLFEGYKPDNALVVDIGGGQGHDVERFRKKYEGKGLKKGALVLQDTPETIEKLNLADGIVVMAHDFFKPQPIKGARAYYLHMVLHDWPPKEALSILRNIVDAMERGYSRLLLHETVINTSAPNLQATSTDFTMMMIASAAERTSATWQALLEEAGLKIVKVWTNGSTVESVIEAKLA